MGQFRVDREPVARKGYYINSARQAPYVYCYLGA